MTAAGPRILVVNESGLLAGQLQQMLAAVGVEGEWVEPAALPAAASTAAVALIEIQLLHGNGFQLARQVRAACACKVVLVSGSGRATDMQWGLRAGAHAVVARPLQVQQLQQTLNALGMALIGAGEA